MNAQRICFDLESIGPRDERVLEMLRGDLAADGAPSSLTAAAREVLEECGLLETYESLKSGKRDWLAAHWGAEILDTRLRVAQRKAAVDTLLAEVIVGGLARDDEEVLVAGVQHRSEEGLLAWMREMFELWAGPETWWIGHNCRGFDIPLLITRWRRYGIRPPAHFPQWSGGRVYGKVFDTMRESGTSSPFTRAQKAAVAHGLTDFKVTMWEGAPMDGSRVAEAHERGEWQVLLDYCSADVAATRSLAGIMTYGGERWPGRPGDGASLDRVLFGLLADGALPAEKLLLLADCLADQGLIGAPTRAALLA